MSFTTPVFLAACAYTLGTAVYCKSKEDDYSLLYDQMQAVKEVKDTAFQSAQNNPGKLALLADYYEPKGEVFSRRNEFSRNGTMLTLDESREELRKLDKQLKSVQQLSPLDILFKKLGYNRGWRRDRPIPL